MGSEVAAVAPQTVEVPMSRRRRSGRCGTWHRRAGARSGSLASWGSPVTRCVGNAVVVAQLLAARGVEASVRTVQRAVAHRRRELLAADLATVRFETAPGRQMQIDFGERKVWISGDRITVHFMAAVLSYSRRLFVKAFLHERQGDWLDGIASAFRHFGGVPLEVLGDNTRCLVVARNRDTQTVTFHPSYVAFCRDWDVQPRACRPYRARTRARPHLEKADVVTGCCPAGRLAPPGARSWMVLRRGQDARFRSRGSTSR